MDYWKKNAFIVIVAISAFVLGGCLLSIRSYLFNIPDIIVFPPFLIGLGCFFYLFYISYMSWKCHLSIFSKLCFSVLAIMCVISMLKGNFRSLLGIRDALLNVGGIGVWLAFLLIVPAVELRFWRYFTKYLLLFLKIIILLEIPAIILIILGNDALVKLNFTSSISIFILMWGLFLNNHELKLWGFIGLVVFVIHSFVHGQRESFLLPIEFALIVLPFYLMKLTDIRKQRKTYLSIIALLPLLLLILSTLYFILPSTYKSQLSYEELNVDTRTQVFNDYVDSEMRKPSNFLFGKGVNGYYQSFRSNDIGGRGTSLGIEIGYLKTILNVGLVYVLATIMLALPASISGLFFRQNSLVYASAIWVLVRLVNMTIAAVPHTYGDWFMFWLCMGVLLSKEIRSISERQLQLVLFGDVKIE